MPQELCTADAACAADVAADLRECVSGVGDVKLHKLQAPLPAMATPTLGEPHRVMSDVLRRSRDRITGSGEVGRAQFAVL